MLPATPTGLALTDFRSRLDICACGVAGCLYGKCRDAAYLYGKHREKSIEILAWPDRNPLCPCWRVLFLNPPFLERFSRPQRSPAVTRSGTLYMPLWLASCCAVLEDEGHEALFIDAPAEGLDLQGTVRRAEAFSPALAVLDTSTPSIAADLEAARAIKQHAPGCVVILVGPHASALPEQCLADPGPDAVARREYEHTVRDVARAVALSADTPLPHALARIPGLSWREGGSRAPQPGPPLHRRSGLAALCQRRLPAPPGHSPLLQPQRGLPHGDPGLQPGMSERGAPSASTRRP